MTPPLVMVHGIFDDGRIFNAMRRHLEPRGIRCLAPSLRPSGAALGLEDLAEKLRSFIDTELGPNQPLTLLGFSMGAVVGRYYLQNLEGHARTRQFLSISAPYRGSLWARLAWWHGARQLRPDSGFLQDLAAGEACLQGLALHSFWTPLDLMILPPRSSLWGLAENHRIWSLCHPCMLHNRQLMEKIHGIIAGEVD